tara:strand:+ start:4591 stop:4944 length:354 start_codon:yes stop_codon:yes gene_type:complete
MSKTITLFLSNIKGCFCTAPSFYTKSNRKILKEDIKSNGVQKNLLALDFKKENLAYRYYISDGNNRLRILKDLAIEQDKKLEEETILVKISENEEEYDRVLQHVKNGDFNYKIWEKI